jgi:hypothetical protein
MIEMNIQYLRIYRKENIQQTNRSKKWITSAPLFLGMRVIIPLYILVRSNLHACNSSKNAPNHTWSFSNSFERIQERDHQTLLLCFVPFEKWQLKFPPRQEVYITQRFSRTESFSSSNHKSRSNCKEELLSFPRIFLN